MIIKSRNIEYFVKTFQDDAGKPTIILLHGFMGSGRAFKYLIPCLKFFCNPVTIDLLGHGKTSSANSADRFSVNQQIDDLHHIITTISNTPPCLYGYSMGGRLALRYALSHPAMIDTLILESTNFGIEKNRQAGRLKIDQNRAEAINSDFLSFLDKWQKLPLFQSSGSIEHERYTHYQHIQCNQRPKQMALSLQGFGAASMPSAKDELPKLQKCILLLAGHDDTKYVKVSRKMNYLLPNSERKIITNAGHRVHLEQPEAIAEALTKFIFKSQL